MTPTNHDNSEPASEIAAGRELAFKVAGLMGIEIMDDIPCDHPGCLHHVLHPCEGCGRHHPSLVPDYPGDISAAWAVILRLEEIDPDAIIRVSNGDGDSCDVDILADVFSKLNSAHVSIKDGTLKDDAPEAICLAALAAVDRVAAE